MTLNELRQKLFDAGIQDTKEFNFVLNVLLEHLLTKDDPPMDHFFDEELAFAKGFVIGAFAMSFIWQDAIEELKQ